MTDSPFGIFAFKTNNMKTPLIALLALALWSCKTKAPAAAGNGAPLTGKLVISALCNHFVVSIESGSYDTAIVAASWKDDSRNASFPNAFTVSSTCSFAALGLKEGDRFSFELAPGATPENCATCMAFYPTPQQRLAIRNVKKLDN